MKCLDTTFFLDLRGRGGTDFKQRAVGLLRNEGGRSEVCTTRFNVAELYVGIEMSRDPDYERVSVRDLLSGVSILDFDDRSAKVFARIWAKLCRLYTPIGDMNVLIASVAISPGTTLVSRNTSTSLGSTPSKSVPIEPRMISTPGRRRR